MPRSGAGRQKLGYIKKCYITFSSMLTPSKDIMLKTSHPYHMGFGVLR